MHELLLFGQVAASRHDQVLNVLAGIAALQPQPILEKHLIFKPNKKPGTSVRKQVGGAQDVQKGGGIANQAQDLYYLHMVANVSEKGSQGQAGDGKDVIMNGDENSESILVEQHSDKINASNSETAPTDPQANAGKWTLQFRDIPEVARQRPVTSRLIDDSSIVCDDPIQHMAKFDHSYVSSYILSGHRFTHLSTSLLFYRLLIPTSKTATPTQFSSTTTNLAESRLLDPSGNYVLQASLRVQDGSKVETMNKGANELMSLKDLLKGCVELEIGDRLALDTRAK